VVNPLRSWVLAIRPATLSAGVAPVLVGTAIAGSRGSFHLLAGAAVLAGALLIQIGTNLANDYFDYRKGGDTSDRVGPVRVTQAGLLPPEAVLRGAILVLLAAALVGLYLIYVGGLPIFLVGLLSLICAVAYTGGPFPIAYLGLGEVFTLVFFGFVAVGGTYWIHAGDLTWDLLIAGGGVGALVTAILVVNNLRDIETDARAGKRTLAVRLGRRGTQIEYLLLCLGAALSPIAGWIGFGWSPWTLLALAGLVRLARPAMTVFSFEDPRQLNPALGQTARGVTWYSGLLALGFVLPVLR
jgi:1,4-dihydroxy-2-naphthoate octaprenyltransferase